MQKSVMSRCRVLDASAKWPCAAWVETEGAAADAGSVLLAENCGSAKKLCRIQIEPAATGAAIGLNPTLLFSGDLRAGPERRLWPASDPDCGQDDSVSLAWDKTLLHLCAASEAFGCCIHLNGCAVGQRCG